MFVTVILKNGAEYYYEYVTNCNIIENILFIWFIGSKKITFDNKKVKTLFVSDTRY